MQELPAAYLGEIARQIAFVGAFLGGFAATFLATLLVAATPKRVTSWVIGAAAVASCAFIVAVIASVSLTTVSHPETPEIVRQNTAVDVARIVSTLGFGIGISALLVSVGLSGWIRSRRAGVVTSTIAGISLLVVGWAMTGFGGGS